MKHTTTLAILSSLALTACGGGDSGSGSVIPPGPPEFDAYIFEASALAARTEGLGATLTFPMEDGVTMTGLMILAEDIDTSPDGYTGDFTATVNFASGEMSGSATDFYYAIQANETSYVGPAVPRDGTILLQSSAIAPGLNSSNLSGTLQVAPLETAVSVTGSGSGGFVGPNGDVYALEGLVTTPGFAETFEVGILAQR